MIIYVQGDLVHQLKEKGASEQQLSKAVAELKARKRILQAKVRVLQLLVKPLVALLPNHYRVHQFACFYSHI